MWLVEYMGFYSSLNTVICLLKHQKKCTEMLKFSSTSYLFNRQEFQQRKNEMSV